MSMESVSKSPLLFGMESVSKSSWLSGNQIFLLGIELKATKREYSLKLEDDYLNHYLTLRTVCLGANAKDELHTVEMKGLNYNGEMTRVHLATLKPSILSTINFSGFEVRPPISFHLTSGSGPVHISCQHLISQVESEDEDEEENNTSPVKNPFIKREAPSNTQKPFRKKLKLQEEEEDDEDEDSEDDEVEEDEDDNDSEEEGEDNAEDTVKKVAKVTPLKGKSEAKSSSKQNGTSEKKGQASGKPQPKVTKVTPVKGKSEAKAASKQNSTPEKKGQASGKPQPKTPEAQKDQQEKSKRPSTPRTPPSVSDVKARLKSMAEKGEHLPKKEQKFENFLKFCFNVTDIKVIKELWIYKQTLTESK